MDNREANLATARKYLKAIELGANGDEMAEFFSPEVIVEIFPSKFFPKGSRSDLGGIRAAANRGKKAMARQEYRIINEMASENMVALEIDWVGTLAAPFQEIPAGGQMRAHFAAFLEFMDGKILRQRNYDCYES
jgi:ketosteroid isomerase-like protein